LTKKLILSALLFCLALFAQDTIKDRYCLPNSYEIKIDSKFVDAPLKIYLALPRGYDPKEKYPLIVSLDAEYSFALIKNITEHFSERRNIPPIIVVSIAYAGAYEDLELYRINRTRDYTPTYTLKGGYGEKYQRHSGGADNFISFIESELFPYLAENYSVNENEKTIVGHSYGGLFSTYVLVTRPELFNNYIIVSPSLWYDEKVIFDFEKKNRHDDINADVFYAVGSYENQPENGRAMVDDLNLFANILKKRNYENYESLVQVFENETHNSIFPTAFTRGIRLLY
jgi:predicted alpha/beta superfamily hydrolase